MSSLSPLIPPERTLEGVLGLDWLELSEELTRVRFEVSDRLRQPMGIVHGGVYSAVGETMASVATARAVWERGCFAMGMSNQASFLRPVVEGVVEATARRRYAGAREWVWEIEFRDYAQRLCCLVTVTMAVRPRGDSPAPWRDGPRGGARSLRRDRPRA